ncbi:hypothetical protein ACFQ6U_22420 [Streptomyces sp. NPDC056465]|uniref:hypothetical protein n=1 Tax=Streptomyces sp. NPDC056465 TaxID=3345829 RepID=UPI003673E1D8
MTDALSDPRNERAMYELLGRMVSMAAHLELRLQMLATNLVETPYAAHWIHGENASKVIKLIGDVAKEHPAVSPGRLEEIKKILKQCTRLFDRRHGYVHGAWSVDGSDPDGVGSWQTMRFTRGKQTPTFAPLSAADLADLNHGFDDVMAEVMAWMIEHINPGTETPSSGTSIADA